MRSFIDLDGILGSVPAAVVLNLSAIDHGRGSELLYREQLPGLLTSLADRARIASITASSAIEGVVIDSPARAERIISGRADVLRTRSEQELAGYRDAQDYLFRENWKPLNAGLLLHVHRMLFAHASATGGRFKAHDNLVVDCAADGRVTTRFRPVAAAETEFYVAELVERFDVAYRAGRHHPVLVIGLFALDLLVVHPFEDGNGRVTRAVTTALLFDAGYSVGRYVSLEESIADRADEYYETLLRSTHGWHAGESDPWPWLGYLTTILAGAYERFGDRAAAARSGGTKQDRVRDYVLRHAPARFRIADVRTALPVVSDQTIRIALDDLRRAGLVSVDGVGRGAAWERHR
ncbi:MAG: Fic family protein [Streptosporangiales bacterium]|nr:Fic family protein [Streptosporangiales bacterium]